MSDDTDTTTEIEPNVPLLRKRVEHIHHHPEEWMQDVFFSRNGNSLVTAAERFGRPVNLCGTVACLAGHTVAGEGWIPVWNDQGNAHLVHKGGDVREAAVVARDLLGLTTKQADSLFSAWNDLRTLYAIANEITCGEISWPDDEPLPDGS